MNSTHGTVTKKHVFPDVYFPKNEHTFSMILFVLVTQTFPSTFFPNNVSIPTLPSLENTVFKWLSLRPDPAIFSPIHFVSRPDVTSSLSVWQFFYFCTLNIIICFTALTEKVKLSMDSRQSSVISTNPLRAATSAMALCASYCPPTISLTSSSCLQDFLWGNKCLYSNNVWRNPCALSRNWPNNSHASRWCTRIGQSKLRMLWPTQMGDSLLAR